MQYPDPLDESSMRSFLGMVNQFSKFFPDLSHLCKPLREKLKKEVIYEFGPVEEKHFKMIKEAMSTRMNLVAYSPERFTRLYHDACDTGLAYMLVQRHDEEECWCGLEGHKCSQTKFQGSASIVSRGNGSPLGDYGCTVLLERYETTL